MKPIMTTADVRRLEQAIDAGGVSLHELMLRAGRALAREAYVRAAGGPVVVLAGFGNNGGDGWVAAEELVSWGLKVTVVAPIEPADLKGELPLRVSASALSAGVSVCVHPEGDALKALLGGAKVIIDAMLGTGFHGGMREPFRTWTSCLAAVQRTGGNTVISADVPSGLSAETGHAAIPAVRADVTVTMITVKPGLLSDDGRDLCGAIIVAPLTELTPELLREIPPCALIPEPEDYRKTFIASGGSARSLRLRGPRGGVDKFSRGTVLVVAGSRRYPGAAALASLAAARMGAGYVTLAAPAGAAEVARRHLLEIPVLELAEDEDGGIHQDAVQLVLERGQRAGCVLFGPGVGTGAGARAMLAALLDSSRFDRPLIIDADGLNCLAYLGAQELLERPCTGRQYPVVLTPHAGELGRLVNGGAHTPDSLVQRREAARFLLDAAPGRSLTIVSKASATVCMTSDTAYVPRPGPAALATAGSGDVLAGMMASAFAQANTEGSTCDVALRAPIDPALVAAAVSEIHGIAGRLAQQQVGRSAVMAGDLIAHIGQARDSFEDAVFQPGAAFRPGADLRPETTSCTGTPLWPDSVPGEHPDLETDPRLGVRL